MERVIELARRLGRVIASHERFREYKEAQKAVESDPETRRLLDEYEAQERKIAELEAALKPVEPEDKRALEALREKAAQNPLLKRLLKARVDYAELMHKVNEAIKAELNAPPQK